MCLNLYVKYMVKFIVQMSFQSQHIVKLKGLKYNPWLYLKAKHMVKVKGESITKFEHLTYG